MALFDRKPIVRTTGDEKTSRLTRKQAAQRLGCGESTVRRLEAKGDLPPHSDHNGITRYNAADVARVGARRAGPKREGETAALAFRLFGEGASVADVVIECSCTPEVARKLFAQWGELRLTKAAAS